MAICGGCGSERTQVRTIFDAQGNVSKEECSGCNPASFEPQWKKERGAMAWEAYPNKYKKIELPDGRTGYRSTDEWRQDSEDKIRKSYERADQPSVEALERKRAGRRTAPMTEDEIRTLTERWRPVLEDMQEKSNRGYNDALSQLTQ
jgi:hypothetical protein